MASLVGQDYTLGMKTTTCKCREPEALCDFFFLNRRDAEAQRIWFVAVYAE